MTPLWLTEAGALVMEVDHDRQVVHTETLGPALHEPEVLLAAMRPSEEHVASRLTSPIVSTHLDTRNVAFERSVGAWYTMDGDGGEIRKPTFFFKVRVSLCSPDWS